MANTTNFNWETPDDTDLVKDGAAAIRTLGSSIDTSLIDLKGGTTGQVLSKNSNTDMDFTWVVTDDTNAIQNAIMDAKGDLIVASADNTPARLPIGSNGFVLTADSVETTGVKWAAAASGGSLTLLSTTSLSGATTTPSIDPTGYNHLQIVVEDWQLTGTGTISARISGQDTDPQYAHNGTYVRAYNFENSTIPQSGTNMPFAQQTYQSGDKNNVAIFNIFNASATNVWKLYNFIVAGASTVNDAYSITHNGAGSLAHSSAVSSFSFTTTSTFSGGSIKVYGVK
jgi:hypothetical protein